MAIPKNKCFSTCFLRIKTLKNLFLLCGASALFQQVGFNAGMGATTEYGDMLLERLKMIYSKFDKDAAAEEAHLQHLRSLPEEVDTGSFYGSSSNGIRHWTNLTADTYIENDTDTAGRTDTGRSSQSRRPQGRGNTRRASGRGRAMRRGRGCSASQVS